MRAVARVLEMSRMGPKDGIASRFLDALDGDVDATDAQRAWDAVSVGEVSADARTVKAPLSRAEFDRCVLAVASASARAADATAPERLLAGLAGAPGAGKTILAVQLAAAASQLLPGPENAAHLPLDGFHRANDDLRASALAGGGTLYERKGRPETFDAEALARALDEVKTRDCVALPLYDRVRHDPAPGALVLDASVRVVFVEGNFLYLDQPRWRDVAAQIDVRLFLSAPRGLLRANMSERFARGGKGAEAIADQWRDVDEPNADEIEPGAARAHIVIVKDESNALAALRR